MSMNWTGFKVSATRRRMFRFCWICALFAILLSPAFGQRTGGGSNSAGSPGSTATPGGSTSTGLPSTNYPGSTNFPGSPSYPSSPNIWQSSRPIFLSGRVMFSDGTKPNTDIRIERVCGGTPQLEGRTDSKGQFSFQIGQNGAVDTDASDASSGGYGRPASTLGTSNLGSFGNGAGTSNYLWNCELRASYPGYRSDVVELGSHRYTDNPNVGTIILHRMGASGPGTISLTTALVPKHAQKEYEKGMEFAEKGKVEEAEKKFVSATTEYPKYAIAWFALGQLQQREGNIEGARKSYDAAIEADAKYASPYDQLALLSAKGQDWGATAKFSQQAIALDPVDFPGSFWYNALANYELKKPEEAEKSVKALLRIDTAHQYPEAERMYAEMLLSKGEYEQAAAHLRTYLAIAPNGSGAAVAKEQLAKLDQAKATPSR